jgi:hypothetical protein
MRQKEKLMIKGTTILTLFDNGKEEEEKEK